MNSEKIRFNYFLIGKIFLPFFESVKIQKHQLVVDVAGSIQSVSHIRYCSRNDGKYWRDCGVRLVPRGVVGCGDKAYQASSTLLYPQKVSKNSKLTQLGKRFNIVLNILRTPVERAFSRLHRWGFIRYSIFSVLTTSRMLEVACRIERQFFPVALSDRMYYTSGAFMHATRDSIREKLLQQLSDHPETFDLRTRNSKKRRKTEEEFKRHRRNASLYTYGGA